MGLGEVGRRRAIKLRDHGAKVVAMDRKPVHLESVTTIQRELEIEDIPPVDNYFLVVAATNDEKLNASLAKKAKSSGVLINRAGNFEEGDLIFPAVVETDDNSISVTTFGKDPRLVKKIKGLIEDGLSNY